MGFVLGESEMITKSLGRKDSKLSYILTMWEYVCVVLVLRDMLSMVDSGLRRGCGG